MLADDWSAGLAWAEGGETIERCAIPLDLLIEALSNEFAEADANRIPMTSGRQLAANYSMYRGHRALPRFTLLIAIRRPSDRLGMHALSGEILAEGVAI